MSKRMRREREKTEVLSESERLIHSELVITFPAVERHGRFGGGPLFLCEWAASSVLFSAEIISDRGEEFTPLQLFFCQKIMNEGVTE